MYLSEEDKLINNTLKKWSGIEDLRFYNLINNYGYKFTIKGQKYDMRHWLNCYGCEMDYWSVKGFNGTLEQTLDYIKNTLL